MIISRDASFLTPKPPRLGSTFNADCSNDEEEPPKTDDEEEPPNKDEEIKTVGDLKPVASQSIKKTDVPQDDEMKQNIKDESGDSDSELATRAPDTPVIARRSERKKKLVVRDGYISYFARDCTQEDPTSRQEAIESSSRQKWIDAMKDELTSFEINGTWSLVDLPPGRKPIKTMWVFKTKRAEDGTITRYKARLVAKGCSQKYGIDYGETFSPVVRYSSIRILIALAAQRGLQIDQMDAITAYLQGNLDEEIYTLQPDGYDDGSGRVCKLHKAMYGLKQSGRQWNGCLDAALLSFGLIKSDEDPCVYLGKDGNLIVAIYVDDFLIFWKDATTRDELKNKLSAKFHMKDLGRAKSCVGITIEYEKDFITINQEKYAMEILEKYGMDNCKPVGTPCDVSQKLSRSDGPKLERDVPYREVVGSLLFLVQATRPDLAFAVSNVSRFNDCYNSTHWTAVKQIMRYVRGTSHYRIAYRRGNSTPISGFVDADWANDPDEWKSYVFILTSGAITWSCKRQTSVAVSSTEAEYVAMSHAAREAVWLTRVIRQFEKLDSITIRCDNQSAMALAHRVAFSPRVKHIAVSYHFCRQHVINGLIKLEYVPSEMNVADCLTKAVSACKMKFGAKGLGLFVYQP